MREFDVSVSQSPHRIVVTPTGELDIDTCPYVTQATEGLALRDTTLTVDMSSVSFMDSSSLNMLLRLRLRAQAEGGTLELCGLRQQAQRVLEITGAKELFLAGHA
ncbi:STAS domain-containing protein [Streptomyces sp. NPDC019396]|uniref:STAS domain-containing protein n=1 Tax=Streptomyces sp. NPDC019396 TaxID=3154687 RepID=UPI0033D1C5C5